MYESFFFGSYFSLSYPRNQLWDKDPIWEVMPGSTHGGRETRKGRKLISGTWQSRKEFRAIEAKSSWGTLGNNVEHVLELSLLRNKSCGLFFLKLPSVIDRGLLPEMTAFHHFGPAPLWGQMEAFRCRSSDACKWVLLACRRILSAGTIWAKPTKHLLQHLSTGVSHIFMDVLHLQLTYIFTDITLNPVRKGIF